MLNVEAYLYHDNTSEKRCTILVMSSSLIQMAKTDVVKRMWAIIKERDLKVGWSHNDNIFSFLFCIHIMIVCCFLVVRKNNNGSQ